MTVKTALANVNNLSNKLSYINDTLLSNSLDIFAVTETWLTPNIGDSFLSLSNYKIVRSDSPSGIPKHGVCFYVSNSINYVQVDCCCPNTCIIHLTTYNMYVIVTYRPPSYTYEENLGLIDFLLEFCYGKEILLMGDFNLPTIEWTNGPIIGEHITPRDMKFLECFSSLGLKQWVLEPTITTSNNTLDLIFTSEEDRVGLLELLPPLPNCCHTVIKTEYIFQIGLNEVDDYHPTKRAWHLGNYKLINENLSHIDWQYELQYLNVENMCNKVNDILKSFIERFVPLIDVSRNFNSQRNKPPNNLLKRKQRAWNHYKQCRTQYGRNSVVALNAITEFHIANDLYRNYNIASQVAYEQSLADKLKDNPKLIHSYVRRKKVCPPSVGPLRLASGVISSDCSEMAECLADAFASVYVTHVPDNPMAHQVFDGRIDDIEFTVHDVLAILKKLDVNSSMGPDGIHPNLLKQCAEHLAYPFYLIFRKSLSTSTLPSLWKLAIIIAIFKKGSRYAALNYRPISLTSVCGKTMERIIVVPLYNYLLSNNLITVDQYGFLRGRSVEDQLLIAYDDVTLWLDNGYAVDMVMFDFQKAFDVVNHDILIAKLSHIGVRGALLNWIRDFLVGRDMCVAVSGCNSSSRRVLSGVPQGSVLGPLLFLVYVNNVPCDILSKCKIFADDLKLYLNIRHNSTSEMLRDVSSCQKDINSIVSTAESWGLTLNPAKCAVLRFQRGNIDWASLGPYSEYYLHNSKLNFVNSHTDLGVIIDTSLKFHNHIRSIANKANGLASNLLRSTLNRTVDFMIPVYKTHIRPLLEFSSCVWFTEYIGDLKLLESTQRRWTKQIAGMEEISYDQRLSLLNLYSVKGRLIRADLIKYWKILHNLSPVHPQDLFVYAPDVGTRGHRLKLAHRYCQLECRRRYFSNRCITLWNSLPSEIANIVELDKFKLAIHDFLGQKLFEFDE